MIDSIKTEMCLPEVDQLYFGCSWWIAENKRKKILQKLKLDLSDGKLTTFQKCIFGQKPSQFISSNYFFHLVKPAKQVEN